MATNSTTVKPQSPLAYYMSQVKVPGERNLDVLQGLTPDDKADLIAYAEVEMNALGLPIKHAEAKAA